MATTDRTTATAEQDRRPPLVSVVVPTYRRPHLLREALASATGQSLTDLEILVCDNAAESATREVVQSFADDRLHYVPRPTNLGMIGNALDGFRQARGTYVVKLDDDDALLPDALERLVGALERRPDATVAFGEMTLVDLSGRVLEEQTHQLRVDTARVGLAAGYHTPASELAVRGSVCLAASVLRRAAIDWDAVPAWADTAYDLHLVLEAVQDGATAYFDPEPVTRYRIHGANDSVTNVIPNLEAGQRVLRQARSSGRHPDSPAYDLVLCRDHERLSREYLLVGDRAQARRHALRSLRAKPSVAGLRALMMAAPPVQVGQRIAASRRAAYLAGRGV
ncbi:glycosyltransferase family 2 protein [Arsenicicoccus dermatophilus]|uniref:glycosyltransferase family 2 protein n=1 Tax=Arsenicicoccus dermatophilus TaxID=1076331 RepID=UPI003916EFE7